MSSALFDPVDRSHHRRAVVAAVVVTVLWSSSWVLIRQGLDDEALPPLTFAGLRYGLAAAVLWTWTGASASRRLALRTLDRGSLASLALLGVVFYAVTQGAQFVAIDNQPAATSSLVLSMSPLLVGLVSHRSLGEVATGRQLLGAVLVAIGALAYFGGGLGATAIGMMAALVALAANVASAVLGRAVNRTMHLSSLTVTTVSMTIGAVLLIGVGVLLDGWPDLSGRAVLVIAWLAVVNTALAFTLWNSSLRRLSAMESAGLNNTMLVQIGVLAWVFLGEFPGPLGLVGIVAVSIGVVLTQLATPGPVRQTAPHLTRGSR